MAETRAKAEVKEEVKEVKVDKVAKSLATPFSAVPKKAEKKAPAVVVGERKEILFQTPNGKLCKKIMETVRTKHASYRRCVQVLKGVKG